MGGLHSHPLTAHERVGNDVTTAVQKAFAEMYADSKYEPLLKAILMPKPINADYDRDYRFLEDLKLEKYVAKRTPSKN